MLSETSAKLAAVNASLKEKISQRHQQNPNSVVAKIDTQTVMAFTHEEMSDTAIEAEKKALQIFLDAGNNQTIQFNRNQYHLDYKRAGSLEGIEKKPDNSPDADLEQFIKNYATACNFHLDNKLKFGLEKVVGGLLSQMGAEYVAFGFTFPYTSHLGHSVFLYHHNAAACSHGTHISYDVKTKQIICNTFFEYDTALYSSKDSEEMEKINEDLKTKISSKLVIDVNPNSPDGKIFKIASYERAISIEAPHDKFTMAFDPNFFSKKEMLPLEQTDELLAYKTQIAKFVNYADEIEANNKKGITTPQALRLMTRNAENRAQKNKQPQEDYVFICTLLDDFYLRDISKLEFAQRIVKYAAQRWPALNKQDRKRFHALLEIAKDWGAEIPAQSFLQSKNGWHHWAQREMQKASAEEKQFVQALTNNIIIYQELVEPAITLTYLYLRFLEILPEWLGGIKPHPTFSSQNHQKALLAHAPLLLNDKNNTNNPYREILGSLTPIEQLDFLAQYAKTDISVIYNLDEQFFIDLQNTLLKVENNNIESNKSISNLLSILVTAGHPDAVKYIRNQMPTLFSQLSQSTQLKILSESKGNIDVRLGEESIKNFLKKLEKQYDLSIDFSKQQAQTIYEILCKHGETFKTMYPEYATTCENTFNQLDQSVLVKPFRIGIQAAEKTKNKLTQMDKQEEISSLETEEQLTSPISSPV